MNMKQFKGNPNVGLYLTKGTLSLQELAVNKQCGMDHNIFSILFDVNAK